ncbi:hypothetical protein MSPP1_002941 [Malassezia sp. CBS 17886]|nr:hypothetical protein MSPP1_002941 [Malassezia sp. CBS 17886]
MTQAPVYGTGEGTTEPRHALGVEATPLAEARSARSAGSSRRPGTEEGLSFARMAYYPQTTEQRLETQDVEEHLRRWAERERLQRKNSRVRTRLGQHSALPTNASTRLVRRLSSSFARAPSQVRSGARRVDDGAWQGHDALAEAAAAHGYPAEGDPEESRFVSVSMSEPDEHAALQPDGTSAHSALRVVDQGAGGDLASISFDDLAALHEAQVPPRDDPPTAPPLDVPGASRRVADPVVTYPPQARTEHAETPVPPVALARARAHNFPTVTVGRASSVQHRRSRPQRAPRAPSGAMDAPPQRAVSRAIGSIPEASESPFTGDVVDAAAASPSTLHSDHFDTLRAVRVKGSFASDDDAHATTLRDNDQFSPSVLSAPLSSASAYPKPPDMRAASPERDVGPMHGSWYWSDLVLGCCGFCTSDDDDEEQAAHTNPME